MSKLTASVGAGNAKNFVEDVKTVQRLLNQNLNLLIPYRECPENGAADGHTIDMIKEFQIRVLKAVIPDGKVDPSGDTFKMLLSGGKKPRPAHVQAFIDKLLPAARKAKANWKVPVSICLAQGALESGWGKHVKGNAYFGIKGKSPTGNTVNFTTQEVINGKRITIKDNFRAYKDIEEAADDYGRMLANNKLYAACFNHTNDPLKFADELQKAGYATDPNYARQLKSIITSFNLTEYDQ